jgi:para-nitrobenzyl esterase
MQPPVVKVRGGRVRGAIADGIARFLGIPYAAPPVAELRFQLPQAVQAWDGVRDATRPGPNAPQIIRAFPGLDVTPLVGRGWQRGDEFMTANIWTPDPGARNLPVLVFIHGGAFVGGSSDAAVHSGAEFARAGVLVVAINYRLGLEGFLPIDGVPTNLGLRDQLAALQWVQQNIQAFGGDSSRITVAGESAGAMSIAALISSPLARGLFGRAIVQSGHASMLRSLEVAKRVTARLAQQLNVDSDVVGFRRCSIEACAAAVEVVSRPQTILDMRDEHGRDPGFGLSRFLPVVGDDVLPQLPLDALAKGAGAAVQVLVGTNRDEMNIYLVPTGVRQSIDAATAAGVLGASEPRAQAVLQAYGLEQPGRRPGDALSEAMTDLVFRLPARRFADAHRGATHLYEFGWRSPACNGELGACHALELPFVFNTLPVCTGPEGILGMNPPQEVAQRIHKLWVNFVSAGELPWPEYDPISRQRMALETATVDVDPEMAAAQFASEL